MVGTLRRQLPRSPLLKATTPVGRQPMGSRLDLAEMERGLPVPTRQNSLDDCVLGLEKNPLQFLLQTLRNAVHGKPSGSKVTSYPTTNCHLNRKTSDSPIDVCLSHAGTTEADLHPTSWGAVQVVLPCSVIGEKMFSLTIHAKARCSA